MPALANVTISKVWEGKSGEGKYGPWTAYNFKVEGHDEKFGYFKSGSKPTPVEGMVLEVLQYETKQRGEYTNNDVKVFTLAKGSPDPAPSPGRPDQPQSNGNGRTAREVKDVEIGLYACLKAAAALPQKSPETLLCTTEELFHGVKRIAAKFNPLVLDLEEKIEGMGDPDFFTWFLAQYKVKELSELSETKLWHAVNHFDGAIKAYHAASQPAEEAQRDHADAPLAEPEFVEDEMVEEALPF